MIAGLPARHGTIRSVVGMVWETIRIWIWIALMVIACRATLTAAVPEPTFSKDVAPILFKHCVTCHRPGEIAASVPLVSYETARPWAKAIKKKVLMREMPPWPANPEASRLFRNDPRLSQADIQTLVAWADAGTLKGTETELPPMPEFAQGWLHPKGLAPDAVISLPEFEIPAKPEVPYVTYLAKVPFAEDRWVSAIQVRPGNRAVVHHMAITEVELDSGLSIADLGPLAQLAGRGAFLDGLIGTRSAVTAPGNPALYDMLGVYTPGAGFETYEDGAAKLLRGGKNFYLKFNIHYQSTGRPEKDHSKVALWFQAQPPKHQLFRVPAAVDTIIAGGRELRTDDPGKRAEGTNLAIPPIPPNAGNYEVIGITAYTEPVTIYQFQPHAHLRGKDFKYTIVGEDGKEETVLSVPKYDFNWQLAYDLKTPLKLAAGSKLVVTAHYDNSMANRNNPAPDKEVFFREGQNQTWDEMFTPFIQYTMNSAGRIGAINTAGSRPGKTPAAAQTGAPSGRLSIVEVEGCLVEATPGTWVMTHGSDPVLSNSQATSSAALTLAETKALGERRYQLLGIDFFRPANSKGQKVDAKGVLIPGIDTDRLNVTSLQPVAAGCLN